MCPLGTRLLVFDKRRRDPHAPGAYGASVTYDLPLRNPIATAATLPANEYTFKEAS